MTYHMFSYFIALNLKFLFLAHAVLEIVHKKGQNEKQCEKQVNGMNILAVIAGIQNTLPGSQGNPTPSAARSVAKALRAEHHIYLIDQTERQTEIIMKKQSGSSTPDSAQECLTSGLRRRVVGKSPRLHRREHVHRVRVLLRRPR